MRRTSSASSARHAATLAERRGSPIPRVLPLMGAEPVLCRKSAWLSHRCCDLVSLSPTARGCLLGDHMRWSCNPAAKEVFGGNGPSLWLAGLRIADDGRILCAARAATEVFEAASRATSTVGNRGRLSGICRRPRGARLLALGTAGFRRRAAWSSQGRSGDLVGIRTRRLTRPDSRQAFRGVRRTNHAKRVAGPAFRPGSDRPPASRMRSP
jgi:hypothetical protein